LFCCDLLSKFISLIFWYNEKDFIIAELIVVICFQNLYLWYSDTTYRSFRMTLTSLWFAFKIYIFDILIQPKRKNNCKNKVVICFQNLYLWYSDTTLTGILIPIIVLWFAFKIYIFDILIQPYEPLNDTERGCDLLSKFISLIFWYNFKS